MSFEYAPFSRKSLEVIAAPLKRVNLLDGSVRSTKTITSIIRWLRYVGKETSPSAKLLMLGVTQDTLKRNVIEPLIDIAGERYAHYTKGKLLLFGRTCYCIGADDAAAERRIRGMTVEGSYVDEASLIPGGVLKQSRLRCSAGKGASLWTTNPDNPFHEINTDWIEKAAEIAHRFNYWHFNLDDNLALSEEYKQELRESFTGLWYRRFIEGLWVLAEGVIYDLFNLDAHGFDDADAPAAFDANDLCIDYGTQNPFAAELCGVKGDTSWYWNEFWYSGRESQAQKTDDEYIEDLVRWLAEHSLDAEKIRQVIIDPSAASFKVLLRKRGFKVKDAVNDVVPGIRTTSNRIKRGKVKIHRRHCPKLIREFNVYSWDPKAARRGEDIPLKENDHCLDAVRYHEQTLFADTKPGIKTAHTGTRR